MNIKPILLIAASATFACAFASTIAGCGTARRESPLLSDDVKMPDDPRLAMGMRAFATHCYQCHPAGDEGLGPAINDKPLPQWLIRTQIRSGLGDMPAFSEKHISEKEVEAIAAYLEYLRDRPVEVAGK
jgi:mono/diheme cytochrome c family protein